MRRGISPADTNAVLSGAAGTMKSGDYGIRVSNVQKQPAFGRSTMAVAYLVANHVGADPAGFKVELVAADPGPAVAIVDDTADPQTVTIDVPIIPQ